MKRSIISVILMFVAVNGLVTCALTASSQVGITPAVRTAPSYQEIQELIKCITVTKDHPNGPDVGPDGIINKDILENMAAFREVLYGTKVLGWRGRYKDYYQRPPTGAIPRIWYSVSILMKEPYEGGGIGTDVSLFDFPAEQLKELSSLQVGQSVIFSGTIVFVDTYGEMEIANPTLEPAK